MKRCWCVNGDAASQFGLGALNEYPGEEVCVWDWWLGETMYDAVPQLLHLRDLEEQIAEMERGFKVIILR